MLDEAASARLRHLRYYDTGIIDDGKEGSVLDEAASTRLRHRRY